MILVDTSVWVEHLRKGSARLTSLLADGEVLLHPFVIGELACGQLRNRTEILGLLSALPRTIAATHEEVLRLVETERLHGRGLGWVDVHLLASARLSQCALWTMDKSLALAVTRLGITA